MIPTSSLSLARALSLSFSLYLSLIIKYLSNVYDLYYCVPSICSCLLKTEDNKVIVSHDFTETNEKLHKVYVLSVVPNNCTVPLPGTPQAGCPVRFVAWPSFGTLQSHPSQRQKEIWLKKESNFSAYGRGRAELTRL